MPRLSILIPCLGGGAEFDGTLISVLQNRPAQCEIIVLHTAEYADPYGLAGEVRFVRCPGPPSLVGLINAGIDAAKGDIVHVLACGQESTEGWTEPALAHFTDEDVAAVAPAVTDTTGSKMISAGLRFSIGGSRCVLRSKRLLRGDSSRRQAVIDGPTLAAGFFRRDFLLALGGFSSDAGDRLADTDLALTLQDLDLKAVCEPASRIIQVIDPLSLASQSDFARGRTAERLFWQSAPRVGLALALALHLLVVLADMPSLLGRLVALFELSSDSKRRRRLAAVAARLADIRASEQATIPLPAERQPAIRAAKQRRKAA